ncbi:MAG: flavin reductase family protein [Saprospiraceae bacterium]
MEEKRQWIVRARRQETPDAVTLELEPLAGDMPPYSPGQYLSIIYQVYGQEKRRAYSISSVQGLDQYLHLTIKRVANGECSTRLVRHTGVGDLLEAIGPSGRFVLPKPLPAHLAYIAAGSGITPVMSHLKQVMHMAHPPRVLLLYANRNAENTIFKQTLDAWAAERPEVFTLHHIFSREKGGQHAHFGRLNQLLLNQLLTDWLPERQLPKAHFFICAPIGIQRMAEMCLRVLDVPDAHLHHEQFVPDSRLKRRTLDATRTHRVLLPEAGIFFDTWHNETILNAALRQGIAMPYTCKSGVCFTCLQQLVAGEVDVVFADQTIHAAPGDLINTCIGYVVSPEITLRSQ